MVLALLIKLIKSAVDGFSNLCAFLLVKLGLWLPTLFCLVFLLACAIMQVKLEGATVGLLIGGTIACFVIGGFIALKSYTDRFKTEKPLVGKAPYSNVPLSLQNSVLDYPSTKGSDKVITSSFEYSGRDVVEQAPIVEEALPPQTEAAKSSGTTYQKLKERPYKYDDFKDLREKYFQGKEENGYDNAAMDRERRTEEKTERHTPQYSNWSTPTNERAEVIDERKSSFRPNFEGAYHFEQKEAISPIQSLRREQNQANNNERLAKREEPMIFATRRDPNILVYEYSDRLEFYRRIKGGGLEFVERVSKR